MATIKSFTDILQSKKLAEILPIESADMWWSKCTIIDFGDGVLKVSYAVEPCNISQFRNTKEDIPCWSLTALFNVIPKDESIECSISFGYYDSKGEYIKKWLCAFEKEGETTDDYIIETFDGDNPVDACYQMVIRLKEMNLI